ncbi:MAG TPA: cupin domain-containing protein [Candidatus Obscuribacterales bacterium]
MAIVSVPDEGVRIDTPEAIQRFLSNFGIWYESAGAQAKVRADAPADEVLEAYRPDLERLMKRGGYVTADVIDVTPATPGLDAMLEMFNKEHTHSEDEVRFVLKGSGIFHIHPESGPVFCVEMFAGDMISVPAGTRHWFNLCADRTIRAIRLFKDKAGWTPHYVEDGIHGRYQPLCFGPAFIPGGQRKSQVV